MTEPMTMAEPGPAPPPTLPRMSSLSRTSATLTAETARHVRDAGLAWCTTDVLALDAYRRNLSTITEVVQRRGLSTEATLDLCHLLRVIERRWGIAAHTARSGRALGITADSATVRAALFADVSNEAFETALSQCRAAQDLSSAAMVLALAGRPPEPKAPPEPVDPTPEQTLSQRVDTAAVRLSTISGELDRGGYSTVDDMTPAQASDLAGELWAILVPLMKIRKVMEVRGQQ